MAEITPTTIAENATKPKSLTVDGQSVEQQSIDDQIKADRYKSAQSVPSTVTGLRFFKIKPPGGA